MAEANETNPTAATGATDVPGGEAAPADAAAMADAALATAQAAATRIQSAVADGPQPVTLPDLGGLSAAAEAVSSIDLLSDVELHVHVELGRTQMLVEDVLRLGEGSIVELDKLAGDPVDVYVNQRLIARGEVLVLNDNFCIRISEIVANLEEQAAAAAASEEMK